MVTKVFRFSVTSGAIVNRWILGSDLCRCLCIFVEDQGTHADFVSAIQRATVLSVKIFGTAGSIGSLSAASVLWASQGAGEGREDSATTVSATQPLTLHCSPPVDSPAAFPRGNQDATKLFALTVPKNFVVDVTLEFVLADKTTPYKWATYGSVFQATGAGVGALLGGSLDQNESFVAGQKPSLRPIGLVPAFDSYQP